MGEHRSPGARQARRQHRGAARGRRGASDPQLRRQAPGTTRLVGRAGHGAGAHRLALHDHTDARKRRRLPARQNPERRAAATALCGAQGRRPPGAIAVMEPFISLGLKEGAHIIAASFYRGGEVISPDLTPQQRKAYYDAENEAVDLINGDFYKYAHHVTAQAKGALKPTELLRAFVHYKHVDYYDEALFNRAYEWMKARGMSEGQSQHAALVVG